MNKSVRFVIFFLVTYISLQLAYTIYLWWFNPLPDPITHFTAKLLSYFLEQPELINNNTEAKILVRDEGKSLFNVGEGCNGLSVIIALISFLLAFKGTKKAYLIFLPISFSLIFLANLLRLYALVIVKKDYPSYFVSFHDYAFPAIIYLMAFCLMIIWTKHHEI